MVRSNGFTGLSPPHNYYYRSRAASTLKGDQNCQLATKWTKMFPKYPAQSLSDFGNILARFLATGSYGNMKGGWWPKMSQHKLNVQQYGHRASYCHSTGPVHNSTGGVLHHLHNQPFASLVMAIPPPLPPHNYNTISNIILLIFCTQFLFLRET